MLDDTIVEIVSFENLDKNWKDLTKGIVSAAFGGIPYIGPIIQELFNYSIPNQRIDRIVNFLKLLEQDFKKLEKTQEQIKTLLTKPENASLLHKTCMGCAEAMTDEKIEYFKNIFVYGLNEDIDFQKTKAEAFLNLLMRLTDIEVHLLKYFHMLPTGVLKNQKTSQYLERLGLKTVHKTTNFYNAEDKNDTADGNMVIKLSLNNLISYGLLIEKEFREGTLKIEFPTELEDCFLSPIGEDFLIATMFDVTKDHSVKSNL